MEAGLPDDRVAPLVVRQLAADKSPSLFCLTLKNNESI